MKGKFHFLSLVLIFSISSTLLFSQGRILYEKDVVNGSASFSEYLPLLKNKRVAVVSNLTGKIGKTHLVDTLLSLKVNVTLIFGPEHGFRGDADAGEKVQSNKDAKTGIPVVSLYGKHNKPSKSDLKNIDIVIYDIQDVGVRFYTYISTMSYVMEACADNNKKMVVLDRPNPNGNYIDGPVLDTKYSSFLGL
ncbi:MAG: exo-beta-N-acetylmuramidase NamZ domain-containing protein, partial [Bacteroidota bacterium]